MTRNDLLALYRDHGHQAYDSEGVSQLQHAWQCLQLAQRAAAPPALQLAAWLHDVGHLVAGLPGSPTLQGIDDAHEAVAVVTLQPLFSDAVVQPVALHVAAKRYLVAAQPRYAASLSADSVRSLALQGGPMSTAEQTSFMALPHARDTLRLRVWDDQAKVCDWQPVSADLALQELHKMLGSGL